jgi:hypothetical protein
MFSYVVTDAEGNRATNTVTVVVECAVDEHTRNIIAVANLPNGHIVIGFIGIAGRTYTIQWTANMARRV